MSQVMWSRRVLLVRVTLLGISDSNSLDDGVGTPHLTGKLGAGIL